MKNWMLLVVGGFLAGYFIGKREGRKFDPNYEYQVSDPRTVVAPGFMGAGARAKAFSPINLNLAQRDKIAKGENLMGLLRNKPRTGLMRG